MSNAKLHRHLLGQPPALAQTQRSHTPGNVFKNKGIVRPFWGLNVRADSGQHQGNMWNHVSGDGDTKLESILGHLLHVHEMVLNQGKKKTGGMKRTCVLLGYGFPV